MDLYHALMVSILEDEDAMDKDVADKLKERKQDDADKDEGPPAGSDQRLKKRKMSKDFKPSKKIKEDMGKTDDPFIVKADLKYWFKKPKRPPTPNPEWNTCKTVDDEPTQKWLRPVSNLFKGTCKSYVELEYNMEECYKELNDQLEWNNPEEDRYPFELSKPLPLVESRNHLIVPADYFFNNDLAYLQRGTTDRIYTTSLTKTKAAKLMCSHELYKFSGGTLISVRDKLKDMLNNLKMRYTSVMPRRKWNNLDKKWSRIMVKDIDRQLLERRLLRSLEKFVGGREYVEDLRLLQRTI
uniref:Uncharacterized protein n=1 Tax=Tanacetum cinerariifolium TaxID=118510 RepID=A0A6L2LVE1_TANCI|nr:hypothetical protein [Tanacetum cinerariifolium]